jgi:hypothetical protein
MGRTGTFAAVTLKRRPMRHRRVNTQKCVLGKLALRSNKRLLSWKATNKTIRFIANSGENSHANELPSEHARSVQTDSKNRRGPNELNLGDSSLIKQITRLIPKVWWLIYFLGREILLYYLKFTDGKRKLEWKLGLRFKRQRVGSCNDMDAWVA